MVSFSEKHSKKVLLRPNKWLLIILFTVSPIGIVSLRILPEKQNIYVKCIIYRERDREREKLQLVYINI